MKCIVLMISLRNGKTILVQSDPDLTETAKLWISRGFSYHTKNSLKQIKPNSKNFLIELKSYLELLFPQNKSVLIPLEDGAVFAHFKRNK